LEKYVPLFFIEKMYRQNGPTVRIKYGERKTIYGGSGQSELILSTGILNRRE
jgi:hypothetical protein